MSEPSRPIRSRSQPLAAATRRARWEEPNKTLNDRKQRRGVEHAGRGGGGDGTESARVV